MTSLGEIRWSEHPEWHDATVALPPPGYRLLDAGSSMLRPARVPHVYTSYSPPEDGFHLRLSSAPPTPTLYNSILGWPIPTQMNPAEMARMNDDFLQDAVPTVDYGRYYGVPFGQVSPSGSHELEVDSAEEAAQLPQVSDSETMPIRVGVTPFASKIFFALEHPETYSDCLRYVDSGDAFLVALSNPRLVSEVLPNLFKHDSVTAFTRQLNIYSFKRLSTSALLRKLDELEPAARTAVEWRSFENVHLKRGDPSMLHLLRPRPSPARRIKKEKAARRISERDEVEEEDF